MENTRVNPTHNRSHWRKYWRACWNVYLSSQNQTPQIYPGHSSHPGVTDRSSILHIDYKIKPVNYTPALLFNIASAQRMPSIAADIMPPA